MTRRISNRYAATAALILAIASSSSAQTPPAVLNPADPDLRLWLDSTTLVAAGFSAGDPVTSWVDKSSYGTIMAPRTTTNPNGPFIGDPVEENPFLEFVDIAGKPVPVVRFVRDGPTENLGDPNVPGTGSTDRMYQSNNLEPGFDPLNIGDGTSLTTFIVFNPLVTSSLSEEGNPLLGGQVVFGKRGTSTSVYQMGIWNIPGPALGRFTYVTYDSNTQYNSIAVPTDKTWHVSSMVITDVPDTTADMIQFFDAEAMDPNQTMTEMGVMLNNETPVTNLQNRNASTPEPFALGGHSQSCCGEHEAFGGDIAELIIFAKTLTPQEYSDVASYLSQKYFTPGPGGLAGDFDGDGDVDGDDLNVWTTQFGVTPVPAAPNADANNDGEVDGADLLVWQQNLNVPQAAAAAGAIPEPSTAMLISGGLTALGLARRRRGSTLGR